MDARLEAIEKIREAITLLESTNPPPPNQDPAAAEAPPALADQPSKDFQALQFLVGARDLMTGETE